MNKTDRYRETLKSVADWEDYLMSESNLPGPRGNLELVAAVVTEGDAGRFERLRKYTADRAPENTPEAFFVYAASRVWESCWLKAGLSFFLNCASMLDIHGGGSERLW